MDENTSPLSTTATLDGSPLMDGQSTTPVADGIVELREPGSQQVVGRVAAPVGSESTTAEFHFWAPREALIEKTQLVRAESTVAGKSIQFYGVVDEVYRRSRRRSIDEEFDTYDGDLDYEPPFALEGVTFAKASILRTDPPFLTPPLEQSAVCLGGELEARMAYGIGDMNHPVAVGLVRNGGEAVAGPACVDLDYLLGAMGGHLNVTGIAGVGTKSSFLTIALYQVLRYCQRYAEENPHDPDKPQIRPVILNVKGFDLFWLDHWSTAFTEQDWVVWQQMGCPDPAPFVGVRFFAPQRPGSSDLAVPVGRDGIKPYSWSLEDVLKEDLFLYLFSDREREDDNFALLVADLERLFVQERRRNDGTPERQMRGDAPARTFETLFRWFEDGLSDHPDAAFLRLQAGQHHAGTLRRFYRRLRRIVYESAGIFRLNGTDSHPLDIRNMEVGVPAVVDIQSLPDLHLQRFVVATLLSQAVSQQTGPGAIAGMHYVFLLDELNRFAPRTHSDPITQLIETVAAELRSRGVILLGAQQQASLVSPRVVENAAIRVLGRTGGHELRQSIFSFLPENQRADVEQLGSADKLVHQPSFRDPMHVRTLRPPWAMRRAEASTEPPSFLAASGARSTATGPRRVPRRRFEDLPS